MTKAKRYFITYQSAKGVQIGFHADIAVKSADDLEDAIFEAALKDSTRFNNPPLKKLVSFTARG